MKALTLIQPYATLIAIEAKTVETRSWKVDYRGELAIHAGKTMPDWACQEASGNVAIRTALKSAGYWVRIKTGSRELLFLRWLPAGAVVATCELVACVPTELIRFCALEEIPARQEESRRIKEPFYWRSFQEERMGDYSGGRYAWLLRNVRILQEPIPARGAQGLWDWSAPALLSPA